MTIGNDGLWKVSSDENLVVEFDINNSTNYQSPLFNHYPQGTGFPQPKAIKGFALYDDNGNKYIFGGDTLSVEYSIDLYHTNEQQYVYPWIATSWFLTKVEDRFGNMLYEFTYERGKYLIQMFPPQSRLLNKNYYFTGQCYFLLHGASVQFRRSCQEFIS